MSLPRVPLIFPLLISRGRLPVTFVVKWDVAPTQNFSTGASLFFVFTRRFSVAPTNSFCYKSVQASIECELLGGTRGLSSQASTVSRRAELYANFVVQSYGSCRVPLNNCLQVTMDLTFARLTFLLLRSKPVAESAHCVLNQTLWKLSFMCNNRPCAFRHHERSWG